MSIQIRDGVSAFLAGVRQLTRGLLVEPMPLEYGDGAYKIALASGVMAAGLAANAEVFQFRWVHASNVAMVRSVLYGAWAVSEGKIRDGVLAIGGGFMIAIAIPIVRALFAL